MCCCFIAGLKSSLNLISEINKQQTGKERGQQFFWFVYFLTEYHLRRFSSSTAAQFSQARNKSFKLPVIPTANLILWHCSNSQSALQSNVAAPSTSVTDFASGPILARPRKRECMRTAKIGPDLRFSSAILVTCIPVYLKKVSTVKLSKPANLSESLNWHLNLPEWPFLTQPFFLIVVQNPINFANQACWIPQKYLRKNKVGKKSQERRRTTAEEKCRALLFYMCSFQRWVIINDNCFNVFPL